MQNRKPSTFIRKDQYITGVGGVYTMGDARQIVHRPTRTFKNCSKLIDAIFKSKTERHGKITSKPGPGD